MNLLVTDIKFIANRPMLLTALLTPVFFTLFLLYLFPFISGLNRPEDALSYGRYYSLTAITLVSAIPFIYGILFSFVHLKELHYFSSERAEVHFPGTGSILISRMTQSAVLSFILILPVIYITGAVSTQGWLRSIYAALLLSFMSSFIFLFKAGFGRSWKNWKVLALISLLYLITVPSGLILHHPWNYFLFFSPFYWLSWAWVVDSPGESLLYGIISLAITAVSMVIFYSYFLRRSGTD